jgi:hypothetical protein
VRCTYRDERGALSTDFWTEKHFAQQVLNGSDALHIIYPFNPVL